MTIKVPYNGNKLLKEIVDRLNKNKEIQEYWRCSNIMTLDRMGYNDHGPIHIRIVANIALKILRILIKNGVTPSIVKDYKLKNEDAEVIVVLAMALHDVGNIVKRKNHEELSAHIALNFLQRFLPDNEKKIIYISEILHAIVCHHEPTNTQTIEAGVVRIADALDMAQGRARIPFSTGSINIHSVSALAIDRVEVLEGKKKPVLIKIKMSNSAGIFQIDNLLRGRIRDSGLEDYIHVIAEVSGKKEKKIIHEFKIE
jgi:metal-dependent HD superfamily phosphatase/phosphodiesterase